MLPADERGTLVLMYCAGILIASLIGGMVPVLLKPTHRQIQLAVSFVAGIMLGVSILHLLPHALHGGADPYDVFTWLMLGLLAMFFLERFFCFHHHEMSEEDEEHACSHSHHHDLAWGGAAVGLVAHSFIAGMGLAASVDAAGPAVRAGFGVFISIALHKPFESLTISTLMTAGGSSVRARLLVNALFALVVPLGVFAFFWAQGAMSVEGGFAAATLAFSAGMFLCIALSDLLPELQFHQHDRIKLSLALLLGVAVAWLFGEESPIATMLSAH